MTPPLAPPPRSAKPGVELNSHWNEVYPLQFPKHNGSKNYGQFVGFGNPNVVGHIVSIESEFPATMPQPSWKVDATTWIGAGLVGAIASSVVLLILWSVFTSILISALPNGVVDILVLLRGIGLVFMVLFGLGIGGAVAFIMKRKAVAVPEGPSFTCSVVGSDAFAVYRRSPTADEQIVVPYSSVSLRCSRARTTTHNASGTQAVSESTFAEWITPGGQLVQKFHGSGASPLIAFIDATETAHCSANLNRVLATLAGSGHRFSFSHNADFIHVYQSRLDFSISPQQISVAPSDIANISFDKGNAIIVFANRSQVRVPLGFLTDGKLFLAVLSALQGKSVPVEGADSNESRIPIENRRPLDDARYR